MPKFVTYPLVACVLLWGASLLMGCASSTGALDGAGYERLPPAPASCASLPTINHRQRCRFRSADRSTQWHLRRATWMPEVIMASNDDIMLALGKLQEGGHSPSD
jgi:hypothetical protein